VERVPSSGAVGVTIVDMSRPRRRAVAVAVGVSAACWLVFLALAVVAATNASPSIDQTMLSWIDDHRTSALTTAMKLVTWLGSAALLYAATLMAAVYWIRRDHDWRPGAMLVASLAGSTVLYNIFKRIIERPRPPAPDALAAYAHWSFPSGHATQSMAFAAMLIVLISSRHRSIWQPVVACACVLAVGASRVYLGAHWFTDVLGGYALGAAWASLVVAIGLTARWIDLPAKRSPMS